MATTQAHEDISALAKCAAEKLKKTDPHLFEIPDLGAPIAADEWTALRDEERVYWAENGEHLTNGARTGADLISEDRGE